jgi:hypothetical protein
MLKVIGIIGAIVLLILLAIGGGMVASELSSRRRLRSVRALLDAIMGANLTREHWRLCADEVRGAPGIWQGLLSTLALGKRLPASVLEDLQQRTQALMESDDPATRQELATLVEALPPSAYVNPFSESLPEDEARTAAAVLAEVRAYYSRPE